MLTGDYRIVPFWCPGVMIGGKTIPQRAARVGEHAQPPDSLADRGDAVQDFRGHGVGCLVDVYGFPVQ